MNVFIMIFYLNINFQLVNKENYWFYKITFVYLNELFNETYILKCKLLTLLFEYEVFSCFNCTVIRFVLQF